jgi:hypothetical protein
MTKSGTYQNAVVISDALVVVERVGREFKYNLINRTMKISDSDLSLLKIAIVYLDYFKELLIRTQEEGPSTHILDSDNLYPPLVQFLTLYSDNHGNSKISFTKLPYCTDAIDDFVRAFYAPATTYVPWSVSFKTTLKSISDRLQGMLVHKG